MKENTTDISRVASMFEEVIEKDGNTFRRFEPISAEEAEKVIDII